MTVTKRVRMRLTAGHQNDAKLGSNNLFLIFSVSSSNPRKSPTFLGLKWPRNYFSSKLQSLLVSRWCRFVYDRIDQLGKVCKAAVCLGGGVGAY